MPERNTEILRDLRRQIYAIRKGSPVQFFAVVDENSEVLFCSTSKARAMLLELEFGETDPKPKTRIVQLKSPLAVGAIVTAADLIRANPDS